MTAKGSIVFRLAVPAAIVTLAALAPLPARADFFDDMRKTFTTDIPHFFQDDVPCAFGGQPTSGTKAACNNKSSKAPRASDKNRDAAVPPEKPNPGGNTASPPPSSGQ